jgi:hypothetical protein
MLFTALNLSFPDMLCSKRHLLGDVDEIIKYIDLVPGNIEPPGSQNPKDKH